MNKIPKDFDAIDLFYGVNGLCIKEPLQKAGLTREQLRSARKAQHWFLLELYNAIRKRMIKK